MMKSRNFKHGLLRPLSKRRTIDEIEQESFNAEDEIDYDLEKSLIKFVIEDQWKNSLETYDIEGYMSALWEDGFFYVS